MKTAKQWFEENADSSDASGQNFWHIPESQIEDIQKDALKEAAEIADKNCNILSRDAILARAKELEK